MPLVKATITSGEDGVGWGWGWKLEFENNPPVCGWDGSLRLVRLHIDPFGVIKTWTAKVNDDFTITITGTA